MKTIFRRLSQAVNITETVQFKAFKRTGSHWIKVEPINTEVVQELSEFKRYNVPTVKQVAGEWYVLEEALYHLIDLFSPYSICRTSKKRKK